MSTLWTDTIYLYGSAAPGKGLPLGAHAAGADSQEKNREASAPAIPA
ncbi:MAG: hypothetical protein LBG76_06510 [Treponema sp.]|nr:hypothetical protein [Treponema sp.]